ncbi:MAG: hypothetical protein ABJL44_03045 [Algibacter sp.]
MNKVLFVFLFFLWTYATNAQTLKRIEVVGIVYAKNNDVENVTIYNVSSNKGVVTDAKGQFILDVGLNDRIEIGALQYETVSVTVDEAVIENKKLNIQLIEQVNKLDAILLSQGLSGNLIEDISNAKEMIPITLNMGSMDVPFEYNDDKAFDNKVIEHHLKSLTNKGEFYNGANFVEIFKLLRGSKKQNKKRKRVDDVYQQDELLSPNARRLFEADNGHFFLFGEDGIGLNTNKIINKVTGRTKVLKERVLIEENESLLLSIQTKFSDIFFNTFPLDEDLRQDFFYFCQEDPQFKIQCEGETNLKIFKFLKEKLEEYNGNIETEKE